MLLGHPNNLQLALGAGYCTKRVVNGLKNQEKIGEARGIFFVNGFKKSPKNRGSQRYAQSTQWARTDHENGKCGFCGRFQRVPSIHICP